MGSHTVKTWSSTQKIISLASGEAEFYGCVKGTPMAKGTQGIMTDMGFDVLVHSLGHSQVHTDSSAAKGMASRKGLGKVRHVEVNQLWIQQEVAAGRVKIVKVKGQNNMADILTKHVDGETLKRHCRYLETDRRTDRHRLNPEVAEDAQTQDE